MPSRLIRQVVEARTTQATAAFVGICTMEFARCARHSGTVICIADLPAEGAGLSAHPFRQGHVAHRADPDAIHSTEECK